MVNNVPAGTYFVRGREKNAEGISAPSNERVITVLGCPATPEPPFGFAAGVFRQSVLFSWTNDTSGCAPSAYVLEAGSAPGLADLGVLPLSLDQAAPSGTQRLFGVQGVPPGTYYVRLRGINGAGLGAPTPDREVVIGSPCLPPARPINFQAPTLGNSVTFGWQLEPVAIPPLTTYPAKTLIEAGSVPGAADLAVFEVPAGFPGTIWGPPGTYWTRVKTVNACGSSVVSEDVAVTLTSECVLPGRPRGLDIVGPKANDPNLAFAGWYGPATGGVVTQYVIDVGTAPGLANVRTHTFQAIQGPVPRAVGVIEGLPAGTFFGRVRAVNVCGAGAPSSEATFIVGGPCRLPSAPRSLDVTVSGEKVDFGWPTDAFGEPSIESSSILEIGKVEGAADVAAITGPFGGSSYYRTFSTTLEPGHYFARAKLASSCGVSNPSIEVEFTIP